MYRDTTVALNLQFCNRPVVVSRREATYQATCGDGTVAALLMCCCSARRACRCQRLSHFWTAARSSSAWLLASCSNCLICRCNMCTSFACAASASDCCSFHWPCTSLICSAMASCAATNLHGSSCGLFGRPHEGLSPGRHYCCVIGPHASLSIL